MTYGFNQHASYAMAALMTFSSISAMAQIPASPAQAGAGMAHMQRHDPAKIQAMMVKRQAELKAKLGITPAQEPAWSSYFAAMQPPADFKRVDRQALRAELDKLPTPERIDKMRALRTERMATMNAEMDKREAATKSLYAALSAAQQKTFDADSALHRHGHGEGGHRRHGGVDAKRG